MPCAGRTNSTVAAGGAPVGCWSRHVISDEDHTFRCDTPCKQKCCQATESGRRLNKIKFKINFQFNTRKNIFHLLLSYLGKERVGVRKKCTSWVLFDQQDVIMCCKLQSGQLKIDKCIINFAYLF